MLPRFPDKMENGKLWLYPQFSSFEDIGFSKCGDHLVLEEYEAKSHYRAESSRSSRLPTVVRMPEHILAKCAGISSNSIPIVIAAYNADLGAIIATFETTSLMALSGFGVLSNKMVRSMDTVADQSGNVSSLSVIADRGVITMHLRNQAEGGSSQANVEFTRMPDSWGSLNSTGLTIQVPESRDSQQSAENSLQRIW
jgi:hypothetical protein